MKQNGKTNVYGLSVAAAIAAVYVVLTMTVAPFAWGPIQFRISEMLCVLPLFTPMAIPGVTLGCLIANLLLGSMLPDVIFGTLATFIGALGTYALCHFGGRSGAFETETRISAMTRFLCVMPPILSNMIIIPLVLKYAYHMEDAVWFMMLTVGIGEILAVAVCGNVLINVLKRYAHTLFGT